MNVLFRSPVGALLARPWVDAAGLFGLRRWYLPMSRLWAAANAAGEDTARFRDGIGAPLPGVWSDRSLARLLRHHRAALDAAAGARAAWEAMAFAAGPGDPAGLDRERRLAATRHLSTRGRFYPLLFGARIPAARWQIVPPGDVERDLGDTLSDPAGLYAAPMTSVDFAVSPSFAKGGVREYWLKAPTPAPRLAHRAGSEMVYARVIEPADAPPRETLVFGSGLCLEFELLALREDPGIRLARAGWRVVEPISPYHGLRAMPGFYGGEPFFAAGPTSAVDLVAGQTVETAALVGWCRSRFDGPVAVAGISMSSFVAQQVASRCGTWPAAMRPDAVMLISHSGRMQATAFGGDLSDALGLDRALAAAGWTPDGLARLSHVLDPAEAPAVAPSRIVSVLGETDRWVPYGDGLDLARRWTLPEQNVFRYPLGHLGMPVQLVRDTAPFERLRQAMRDG